MIFRKINSLAKDVLDRSSGYFEIGQDIFLYGKERIMSYVEKNEKSQEDVHQGAEAEKRRENLKKQMINEEGEQETLKRRQESMKKSQGVADHSGSSYPGPGKPGEKTNANMWQRNFENHQGN